MDETDTDTLIALVSSLLPSSQPMRSQAEIMDALIMSNGDAAVAAQSLLAESSQCSMTKTTLKRKRVDLNGWLNPRPLKQKESSARKPESSTSRLATPPRNPGRQMPSPSASTSKPTVNLMDVLRQPESPRKTVQRIPPLILSNREMVAKHTPCSLHLSVLPPELACQLFYRMLDASKSWKRNKWWLFDRVVESPHLTSFFARKTDGISDDESWQEAAQFW